MRRSTANGVIILPPSARPSVTRWSLGWYPSDYGDVGSSCCSHSAGDKAVTNWRSASPVGKRLTSTPISAKITRAVPTSIPSIKVRSTPKALNSGPRGLEADIVALAPHCAAWPCVASPLPGWGTSPVLLGSVGRTERSGDDETGTARMPAEARRDVQLAMFRPGQERSAPGCDGIVDDAA